MFFFSFLLRREKNGGNFFSAEGVKKSWSILMEYICEDCKEGDCPPLRGAPRPRRRGRFAPGLECICKDGDCIFDTMRDSDDSVASPSPPSDLHDKECKKGDCPPVCVCTDGACINIFRDSDSDTGSVLGDLGSDTDSGDSTDDDPMWGKDEEEKVRLERAGQQSSCPGLPGLHHHPVEMGGIGED